MQSLHSMNFKDCDVAILRRGIDKRPGIDGRTWYAYYWLAECVPPWCSLGVSPTRRHFTFRTGIL
ncbi:hypothetical protein E2C01_063815 [Portunus trituberculatus]|uniref:Uncharacterized protein n=1 Tax=Portunus trituberculatus TaxID=210409 RepID=A0A5B7HJ75_PORTR|nr:hypothetical protein [Portunus trituberculatus]